MKKFTKYGKENKEKKKGDDILFENDILKVVSYKGWSFVKESDSVVVIPYLLETNQIILRSEYIPTFEWSDHKEMYLTVISETIEGKEKPEETIVRGLEEECGIVIRDGVDMEMFDPLYMSKGNCGKYHPCIISLSEGDYHEVVQKGDGSEAEKKSKSFKLDVKKLSSVKPSDLITAYLIEKFKKYINI